MNFHDFKRYAKTGFLKTIAISRVEDGWSIRVNTFREGGLPSNEALETARGDVRVFTSLDTAYNNARVAGYMGSIWIDDGFELFGLDVCPDGVAQRGES